MNLLEIYMVHENERLISKFTQESISSCTLLTRPLSSVTQQLTQPPPSLSVAEALVEEEVAEEVAEEKDAFDDISPFDSDYDINPFSMG